MRRQFRTFKELTPILQSHFHKIEEKGTVPNSVYEVRITLTPKPDKYRTKKRKQETGISHEIRCKNPKQNNSKLNPVMYKKNYSTQPTENNSQYSRLFQYLKIT